MAGRADRPDPVKPTPQNCPMLRQMMARCRQPYSSRCSEEQLRTDNLEAAELSRVGVICTRVLVAFVSSSGALHFGLRCRMRCGGGRRLDMTLTNIASTGATVQGHLLQK